MLSSRRFEIVREVAVCLLLATPATNSAPQLSPLDPRVRVLEDQAPLRRGAQRAAAFKNGSSAGRDHHEKYCVMLKMSKVFVTEAQLESGLGGTIATMTVKAATAAEIFLAYLDSFSAANSNRATWL